MCLVSLSISLSISYVIIRKNSDGEKTLKRIPLNLPGDSHNGERNRYQESALKNFSEKPLKDSNMVRVKEKSKESFRPKGYAKADKIVKGVGLSEDELKAIHARQRREIELMSRDMDSIVIPPAKEGDPGMTLGNLLAIHDQQKNEIEKANDWDEIVIPASEDGYPGLSREKLTTLQDQQNYEIWEEIDNPTNNPIAPLLEEGGPNLTVLEIKKLHKRQSLN